MQCVSKPFILWWVSVANIKTALGQRVLTHGLDIDIGPRLCRQAQQRPSIGSVLASVSVFHPVN